MNLHGFLRNKRAIIVFLFVVAGALVTYLLMDKLPLFSKVKHGIDSSAMIHELESTDWETREKALNRIYMAAGKNSLSQDAGIYEVVRRMALHEPGLINRSTAISILPDLGGGGAIPLLKDILSNRSERLVFRLDAAEALGRLGDESGLPLVLETLRDDGFVGEWGVYYSAVMASGRIGNASAIPVLQAFRDTGRDGAGHVLEAIARIELNQIKEPQERFWYLERQLSCDREDVRRWAAGQLVRMKTREALQLVVDAARNEKHPARYQATSVLSYYFASRKVARMIETGRIVDPTTAEMGAEDF